jgi:hypothetical protein
VGEGLTKKADTFSSKEQRHLDMLSAVLTMSTTNAICVGSVISSAVAERNLFEEILHFTTGQIMAAAVLPTSCFQETPHHLVLLVRTS